MNNKVTLQDLAEQLSNISGQSKKLSETFLRSLTEIIEEALEKDGIAKVKGLGTFKIIAIEERKSVSVTDGSAVVIPAHKKITFTPEKELKEAVNKPFEHLETYILPNDGPVDAPVTDDDEEESYMEEEVAAAAAAISAMPNSPIGNIAINAQECASEEPISAINAITTQEEPSNLDIEPEETESTAPEAIIETEKEADPILPEPVKETPIAAIVSDPITKACPTAETAINEQKTANEETANICASTQEAEDTATAEIEGNNSEAEEPINEEVTEAKPAEKKKSKKAMLFFIILLALLILACLIYALSKNPGFKTQFDGIKERITQVISGQNGGDNNSTVTPMPADTTSAIAEEPQESESEAFFPEEEEAIQAEQDDEFTEQPAQEVNYDWFEKEFKNFIKKEHPKIKVEVMGEPIIDTIKAGKTLTAMSRKYYNGGKDFWVYIYLYNKDVIRRPDDVPAGTVIKIPQLHPSMVNPSSYESVNTAKDVKESYLRLFN